MHDGPLGRLVDAAEEQDGLSAGHSQRVMEYACAIGRQLLTDPDELEILRIGAYLHDVGKTGVPSRILSAQGALDYADRVWICKHPRIGYELLRYRNGLPDCLGAVLFHHERLDGSGYPYGLRAHEIPLHARIVAVADVFDAMTTDRPYRRALQEADVLRHLVREADLGRLDERIVHIHADIILRSGTDALRAEAAA